MTIARALLGCGLCLALAACSIKGPEVSVKPPIEIKAEGGGNGKFCPPGQAKKGNC